MIYRYDNGTQTRWDHGQFKVQPERRRLVLDLRPHQSADDSMW